MLLKTFIESKSWKAWENYLCEEEGKLWNPTHPTAPSPLTNAWCIFWKELFLDKDGWLLVKSTLDAITSHFPLLSHKKEDSQCW